MVENNHVFWVWYHRILDTFWVTQLWVRPGSVVGLRQTEKWAKLISQFHPVHLYPWEKPCFLWDPAFSVFLWQLQKSAMTSLNVTFLRKGDLFWTAFTNLKSKFDGYCITGQEKSCWCHLSDLSKVFDIVHPQHHHFQIGNYVSLMGRLFDG